MKDQLGDRMKAYENPKAQARFIPCVPIVARLDGRSFSKFTKGLARPYDERMTGAMVETTKYLVEHTGAVIGYTQSDEITLIFYSDDLKSQLWFDGREQKMVSQLAAQATMAFYRIIETALPKEYADRLPTFDARVFQVPNKAEAVNCLIWREWDATKNSITMAASAYYSHKELLGKSGTEKIEMLRDKGVTWADYPAAFKRGTYIKRSIVTGRFSAEELEALPPKHHAKTNPDLEFTRSRIQVFGPILAKAPNNVAWVFGDTDV